MYASSFGNLKSTSSLTNLVKKCVFSEGEEPEIEASALQKKFVPWKSMFPELESNSETSPSTQLIVVASLIDKLPNLGGRYTHTVYIRYILKRQAFRTSNFVSG